MYKHHRKLLQKCKVIGCKPRDSSKLAVETCLSLFPQLQKLLRPYTADWMLWNKTFCNVRRTTWALKSSILQQQRKYVRSFSDLRYCMVHLTGMQVVAAATEVLASQLTVYKALEEYMLPFGFKRPKHAMQTQVVVTSPPKVPETSEADDEAENDENDENAVVESPVEAVVTAAPAIPSVAPSPFRQPILDAEDAPTPTYVLTPS
jgi:hypothetical protein